MRPARAPAYNYYQIMQCIREIRVDAKGWQTWFHQRGVEPLRIVYEDYLTDQLGALRRIFDFLEIALPADFTLPEIRLKRQADALTEVWVEKYNRGDQE